MLKFRVIAVFAAVCMVITFAACGGGGSSIASSQPSSSAAPASSAPPSSSTAPASSDAPQEAVEIRLAWWGDTARHEVYNGICDRFETATPGVKVIREPISWGDYWPKLATQVAGGNAPDVFGVHPQYVADYASRGALANLEPFIDSGVLDRAHISDNVLDTGRYKGVLCMIPQGIAFSSWMTNTGLATQYNLTLPDMYGDWTWDDFAAQAKAFADQAKGEGMYFSTDHGAQYQAFRWWTRQVGSDLYTVDGGLGFDQALVEKFYAYWKELRDYGAVPDAATTVEDGSKSAEQKLFSAGKVVMTNTPANQLMMYQNLMPDVNLDVLHIPVGDGGSRAEYIEGAHFAASAASQGANLESAVKLISFFVNTKESMELFKMEQGVPANTEMVEFIRPMLDKTLSESIDYMLTVMEVGGSPVYPPQGASELDAAFNQQGQQVQYGEKDPATAAADFYAEALNILSKN